MMPCEKLTLSDIQPSQFLVSEEKLKRVEAWLRAGDGPGLEPIPVKLLDGVPVMTDGHTRAVAALRAGIAEFPLEWEREELDWDMYRECVSECRRRGIFSPAGLLSRVVSQGEYRLKWDGWCDAMQAGVLRRRTEVER